MQIQKNTVPIFFATDDGYAPFAAVAIKSLIENASKNYQYKIHILFTDLSSDNRKKIGTLETENIKIDFVDVKEKMKRSGNNFHLRDYYSFATYYRFFIPEMFPQYKKGIYLDSDIVVLGDISELYNISLGDNLVAAVSDEIVADIDVFGEYVEKVIGTPKEKYFNAGILVMNLERLRVVNIESALKKLMQVYRFPVAQDQDYLNVLCAERIVYLDKKWNKTAYPLSKGKPYIAHYKMNFKPWHYDNVGYEEFFWEYAEKTLPYKEQIIGIKNAYTETDRDNDNHAAESLLELAALEIKKARQSDYVLPIYMAEEGADMQFSRAEILKKIEEYERQGLFDVDVENDPPTRPLEPGEVDYLGEKFKTKFLTFIANVAAKTYFDGLIRKNQLIIKEIRGIENYKAVADKGVIITANHFNPYDNYAVFKAIEPLLPGKRLYRIIREGNYTTFKGLYGFFFRHCDTLPIPSKLAVWREMSNAVCHLISKNNKILIYPEQAMWWNYKKPRPLKSGAFRFAVKSGAIVLPVFITMEDSIYTESDGSKRQAYTVHFLKPIYADPNLSDKQNTEKMAAQNYNAWKEVYETFYGIPLKYSGGEEQ